MKVEDSMHTAPITVLPEDRCVPPASGCANTAFATCRW